MQPPAGFQPYTNNSRSYQQQGKHDPNKNQQKRSTPFNTQLNRNNYHYNYSPSHINHKQNNLSSNTAQQNFYRPQKQLQYQRPQSYMEKREANNFQISSIPLPHPDHKRQLLKCSQHSFPNTYKLLDLDSFIQQNLNLRTKLLQQLSNIHLKKTSLKSNNSFNPHQQNAKSSTRDTTPKRSSREKSSNLFEPKKPNPPLQNQTQNHQIQQLLQIKRQKQQFIQQQKQTLKKIQNTNKSKRQNIQKLQSYALHQSIHQTPLLKQKHQAIEYLSIEVEWMNDKSSQLKKLLNSKNQQNLIFEMYQHMCRQVESLRKENNKKSQKLKRLFEKTNKITGKEENVNMFLMNLKV